MHASRVVWMADKGCVGVQTGMYYLWFVICDEELQAATVRGQTTWKNPTGTCPISWNLMSFCEVASSVCACGL